MAWLYSHSDDWLWCLWQVYHQHNDHCDQHWPILTTDVYLPNATVRWQRQLRHEWLVDNQNWSSVSEVERKNGRVACNHSYDSNDEGSLILTNGVGTAADPSLDTQSRGDYYFPPGLWLPSCP